MHTEFASACLGNGAMQVPTPTPLARWTGLVSAPAVV